MAQRKLSKEEIHTYWLKESALDPKVEDGISKFLVNIDNHLNLKISQIISSLKNSHIDTIGVFIISYPGYNTIDTCRKGIFPSDVYIFWQFQSKEFVKKITNHCEQNVTKTDSYVFFEYYLKNAEQINKEYILPVITAAEIEGNSLKYTVISVSHEPIYTIYYQLNNNTRMINFSESDITYKESLFYSDNLSSKIYGWFTLISSELNHVR